MEWSRILAPLAGAEEDDVVLAAGSRLAELFQARLACVYSPPDVAELIPWMSDGMVGGVEVGAIDAVRATAATGEAASRARFQACDAAGKDFQVLDSPIAGALALEARLSDVVVFGPESARGRSRLGAAFQDVVAIEQRPVFVARQPLAAVSSVLVAWNGGKEASRAARTALPLLRLASRVVVATVGDARARELDPQRLVDFLAGHGVTAEAHALQGSDVCAALLDEARAIDAGILVFGAFGHTRLREFVFGGVTRHLLGAAGPSLFLSH